MFSTYYISRFGSPVNDPSTAFMRRTVICRTKWFSVYIHKFLKSDDGPKHNHPWNFISIILSGSYIESIETGGDSVRVVRKAGSIAFRNAFCFHKINLVKGIQPTTLCITFNPIKNWFYLVEGKSVPWRKYLKAMK